MRNEGDESEREGGRWEQESWTRTSDVLARHGDSVSPQHRAKNDSEKKTPMH